MARYDLFHYREFKVADKAYKRVVVASDRATRIHDRAGLVELGLYVCDDAILVLRDDRNLFDGLEVVGIMIDHECCHEVHKEAHKRCGHIDHKEDSYINESVEG